LTDPYDLERFVVAQAPVYDAVRAELRAGRKRSHWMWFVFPQIRGLGISPTAMRYAVASLDEARAYLAHPLLGPRLGECVGLILALEGRSAVEIFGPIDATKLRSCLTLFEAAAPEDRIFGRALETYFGGERDPATLAKL
jgi:uncharacterized protein (DUF1810 family)